MKKNNQQLPAQLLLRWLPGDKSTANIVTLCEGLGSATRAKDLCGQLAAALRPRTVIVDSIWSFDHLDHYDWYQFADSDVSGADILIVSVSGNNRLPPQAWSWLESLLRARNGKPGVMVTMLGHEKTSPNGAVAVVSQLRQMADRARLDYFCFADGAWNAKLNLSLAPCLAESANKPIREPSTFDQYTLSLPSVTSSTGRIGTACNRGQPTINGRGSEAAVKSPAGRLAESIDSEVIFEAA